MFKQISLFIVGLAVGAGLVWELNSPRTSPKASDSTDIGKSLIVPAVPLSCGVEENKLRQRVRELEDRVSQAASVGAKISSGSSAEAFVKVDEEAEQQRRREAVRWRVSAIEKFVPLTAAQRDRLSDKFRQDAEADDQEGAETLDDILGQESADYYRQQVKAAFQRVKDQETEKEMVWMSHQLSLSADQERVVRGIYTGVEQQIRQEIGAQQQGETPRSAQERVKLMVLENRRRIELRNTQMRAVLSSEQYEAYLKSEAESTSADVEVFHDPGE